MTSKEETLAHLAAANQLIQKDWQEGDPDPPDTQAPIVSQVEWSATAKHAELSFKTDEPAAVALYVDELQAHHDTELKTSHSFKWDYSPKPVGTMVTITIATMDSRHNFNRDAARVTLKIADQPTTDLRNQITRRKITWFFDKPYPVGRFVNGDWWVQGPVPWTATDPPFHMKGSLPMHGAQINPDAKRIAQGYTNQEDLPFAQDLLRKPPLLLQPGDSLVSSITVGALDARPCLIAGEVLTVVREPPAEDAFRPHFAEGGAIFHYLTTLRPLSSLPKLAATPSVPTFEQALSWCDKPWIEHAPGWQGSRMRPHDNQPEYGRDRMARSGDVYLGLLTEAWTDEQRRTIMIHLVQQGIDFYGLLLASRLDQTRRTFGGANGGHHQGSLLPILFAGWALESQTMLDVGKDYPQNFTEQQTTWQVTQADVGRKVDDDKETYRQEDVGIYEWGIQHEPEPHHDNRNWGAGYRQCCTANSWLGHALFAMKVGNLREAFAWEPFFLYLERYLARETKGHWFRSWSNFAEEMWDKHR